MAEKLARLTHKIAIQLHLVAVLAPGGQSGKFWVHRTFTLCRSQGISALVGQIYMKAVLASYPMGSRLPFPGDKAAGT
jgi:hypothetical protein